MVVCFERSFFQLLSFSREIETFFFVLMKKRWREVSMVDGVYGWGVSLLGVDDGSRLSRRISWALMEGRQGLC